MRHIRSEVPPATSGSWAIEKFVIPERSDQPEPDPRPECFHYRPGTYTVLRRDATHFMTDLYDEWWTQRRAVEEAARRGGEILITGLGLGLIAEAIIAAAPSVRRITIIERSPDVIRLVQPYLRERHGSTIEVVEADAFSWTPPDGRRFTVGWHDIWPDPYTPTNASEMERLESHYRTSCDWQGFWPREYLAACLSA